MSRFSFFADYSEQREGDTQDAGSPVQVSASQCLQLRKTPELAKLNREKSLAGVLLLAEDDAINTFLPASLW